MVDVCTDYLRIISLILVKILIKMWWNMFAESFVTNRNNNQSSVNQSHYKHTFDLETVERKYRLFQFNNFVTLNKRLQFLKSGSGWFGLFRKPFVIPWINDRI